MTEAQIREIIDAIGWAGLRREYPQLWSEIARNRAEAKKLIDRREEIECRRVGC